MWHAAWCWEPHFLPYFAALGYDSYALSFRGHGSSEGRERLRWISFAEYVSDVEQVASQMAQPPVLVGHSIGGLVVQKYLEQHDSPAVVLLASVPPETAVRIAARVARRRPLAAMKALLTLRMYPIIGTPELAREALFSSDMPQKQVEDYASRLQDESFRAFLDLLIPYRSHPEQIRTPLLVLGAAEDRFILPKEVAATASALGVKAEMFPGMSHDMMLEADWQMVANRIRAWLNGQGL